METSKLPVIDFSKENMKPGTSSWVSTCKDVVRAFQEYGCFVAQYSKATPELYNALFRSLQELFDLPLETKKKNVCNITYGGYVGNQAFVPILYEGMGFSDATTVEATRGFTHIMWSDGNDKFCQTVHSYSKLIAELHQTVKKMVYEGYGVEYKEESENELSTYLFRMMKYRTTEIDEDTFGCNAHTDKGFITILFQNQVNGLEIKTKDGDWVGFQSSPSSFIVMAGNVLLAWSNGRIHAPVHRVVMNNGVESRYSIGLFEYRKGMVKIPEEQVDNEHPRPFEPFDNFGLLNYFASAEVMKNESAVSSYCGIKA